MEIKEIVKELEYYNEELPKEALEKAIEFIAFSKTPQDSAFIE